ncbi:MAG: ribonuclease D [Desulfuromonadales bacterium]
MKQIEILTTNAQVAELAGVLARETTIAIDLEADSMHNYQEQVCLIQVSTLTRTVLIDPLTATDLSPLQPVLADPAIRKIFHAADYDLRSLKRDFGLEINGLFDTMISAQLLGEERVGLADLLRKYFGVELDKKFQKADWSQRPLPAEMVRYAAEDTRHLHRLVALFEERLKELGRMSWCKEEFALMEQVRFAENGGPLCLRFKGAGVLPRRELGVLEKLMQWREQEGSRLNRPVYKVIGNKSLLELAQRMPTETGHLRGIDGLSPRLIERYGRSLLEAVRDGLNIPEAELPEIPRQPRRAKDPGLEDRVKILKKWRQKEAAKYALEPGVLINNVALEALAMAKPQSAVELDEVVGLKNWQKQVLGEGLLGALA